jgi:uncharacterized protein YkwD
MAVNRTSWLLVVLLSLVLLSACGNVPQDASPTQLTYGLHQEQQYAFPQALTVPRHTSGVTSSAISSPTVQARVTATPTSGAITVGTVSGPSPYGAPPAMTPQEQMLTQKLFALINSDRAQHGLYPFVWNPTLAGGARLHSWNMYHCGFSHTCPDGLPQCQRIANEGFAGYTDCGENIGYAGPFPTAWDGVYKTQESMAHEPPGGWHYIHLFSTTLHRLGAGVYVDPSGYIWFTEDIVS